MFPLTIADAPTVGTAGGIACLQFTGELMSGLPCCAGIWTADAGGVDVPDVDGGENVFLVALA